MTDDDGTAAGDGDREGQLAYVIGPIPNSMFRLRLVDGREIVAHAAKDLRMAFTRLLPDDPVLVDVSAFDPNKARIRKVLNTSRPSQHQNPRGHTQPHPSQHPSQQREMS